MLLVRIGLLEVGFAWELAGRGVGWAMLDGRVPVAKIAEVVDVFDAEEGAGGERVNGRVTPLCLLAMLSSRRHWTYAFHPEAATAVHHLEEVLVLLASEPTEAGNLKI